MANNTSHEIVQRVTPSQIREAFNESNLPKQIRDGGLTPHYLRDDHLAEPQKVNEPFCTRSQIVRYLDRLGKWLVEVHQYLRLDNTIGASGVADPKRMRLGNLILIADKDLPEG